MTNIQFDPAQYDSCPICGGNFRIDTHKYNRFTPVVQGPCQVFLCFNPLANDPLHYYSHTVEKSLPDRIVYQEFSMDLGNKSVLVINNFDAQKTGIKSSKDAQPLELEFLIIPDFSNMELLKNKIRTAITFS